MSSPLTKEAVEAVLRAGSASLGAYSSPVMTNAMVEDVAADAIWLRLPVTDELCNPANNLHGGAIATAIDVFTTIGLYMLSDQLSVTVDLHTTCISSAPSGSDVLFVCKADRLGRSMQFSSCE
eukprot:7367501-Prymnesium_polylepis.1